MWARGVEVETDMFAFYGGFCARGRTPVQLLRGTERTGGGRGGSPQGAGVQARAAAETGRRRRGDPLHRRRTAACDRPPRRPPEREDSRAQRYGRPRYDARGCGGRRAKHCFSPRGPAHRASCCAGFPSKSVAEVGCSSSSTILFARLAWPGYCICFLQQYRAVGLSVLPGRMMDVGRHSRTLVLIPVPCLPPPRRFTAAGGFVHPD